MSVSPRFRLRTVAVAALTFGLLAGTATVASATGDAMTPSDDRAEAHVGNATTCTGGQKPAGLDGVLLDVDKDLTYTGGDGQSVTITDVAEGVTVTGIVVKGGNGYNIYVPGEKGLSENPPWSELISPLNRGGNVPTISHWFACGTKTTPTTSETPPTSDTTPSSEPETPGDEETPGETPDDSATTEPSAPSATTSGPGAAPVTTTGTTEAAPSPAGDSGDLASTGFSGGWLLGVGALLLVGGGALLALTRTRRSKA